MIKLINYDKDMIFRGAVFNLPGQYPYERFVDFMIYETCWDERPLGLIVTTGYHAGQRLLFTFPEESYTKKMEGFEGKVKAIDTNWLVSNWETHIYDECSVKDVFITENYEAVKQALSE